MIQGMFMKVWIYPNPSQSFSSFVSTSTASSNRSICSGSGNLPFSRNKGILISDALNLLGRVLDGTLYNRRNSPASFAFLNEAKTEFCFWAGYYDPSFIRRSWVPTRRSSRTSSSYWKVNRYPSVIRISNRSVPLSLFSLREGCPGFFRRNESCLSTLSQISLGNLR